LAVFDITTSAVMVKHCRPIDNANRKNKLMDGMKHADREREREREREFYAGRTQTQVDKG
jgi:hypothetical protein